MTKEELLKLLKDCEILSDTDEESAHLDADEYLIEYINDEEIKCAFYNIAKWYA